VSAWNRSRAEEKRVEHLNVETHQGEAREGTHLPAWKVKAPARFAAAMLLIISGTWFLFRIGVLRMPPGRGVSTIFARELALHERRCARNVG
jgi:hypothetical protein